MIEIRVTNSEEAETALNIHGIVASIVDSDIIEVHADDWFDSLDILADGFLLSELEEGTRPL